jgi:hypothetical protein
MEKDRYDVNRALYILGMVCLLISIGSLLFSFFMFPYLIFHWRYDVPEFIIVWQTALTSDYGMSLSRASWFISLFFTIIGLIVGVIASFCSTYIDNIVDGDTENEPVIQPPVSHGFRDSVSFFWKLSALLVLIYGSILFTEWVIRSTRIFT